MFRMRTAGYQGPDIFSPGAVNLIDRAANGLMRRVNILADKSLLAAFVEDTHRIEARHVQAAIRDSGLTPDKRRLNQRDLVLAGSAALLTLLIATAGWMMGRSDNAANETGVNTPVAGTPALSGSAVPSTPPAIAAPVANVSPTVARPATEAAPTAPSGTLLEQRQLATKSMLARIGKGAVSIQLFYTEDVRPARMERFLTRAQNMGMLSEIYVIPIKVDGKEGYRVLYGIYNNNDAARAGMKNLPQRYKDAFALTLHELDGY
jgi:hypothetical protein